MKYVDTKVVFREVPDEITLAINISNCPVKCPGCHSQYLAEDIGDVLNLLTLKKLISENPGISCISFMGGDAEPETLKDLCIYLKEENPRLKRCWYSGRGLKEAESVIPYLDFIKVGPYIEELGALDSPTTNQRFYMISHTKDGQDHLTDITERFLKVVF